MDGVVVSRADPPSTGRCSQGQEISSASQDLKGSESLSLCGRTDHLILLLSPTPTSVNSGTVASYSRMSSVLRLVVGA